MKKNQRIKSPFLNNTHFRSTPPFLRKIFHPHPYCQIRGSQFPLYKRRGEGGGSNYASAEHAKEMYCWTYS